MTARKTLFMTVTAAAVAGTAIFGAGLAAAKQGPGEGHRGGHMPMIFEQLDANGDGIVTQDEMKLHSEARFTEADGNGDGKLSAEEMIAAAQARAEEAMKDRAERMSERMAKRTERMIEKKDTDGDGLLTMAELQDGQSRGERFFEKLDTDGDGAVSKEEFEAAKSRLMKRGGHQRGE
ncbi:MAG: EF-hand domain-containing protein [Brevirhabdus sp.]